MAISSLAVKLWPETLRSIAFGSIAATYTIDSVVGGRGNGLLNPSKQYYLVNNTNVLLTFSWDGVNDHFVIPAGSYILLDVSSNASNPAGSLSVPQGVLTHVKGVPGAGSVYLTSFYGLN